MAETVYVFGAGIDRSIRDSQGLRPPLATDLFKQVLRHNSLGYPAQEKLKELFEYIERYWKFSVDDLMEEPFDLEECFTLMQQQRMEAAEDEDKQRKEEVTLVEDQLTGLLTRFLGFMEPYSAGNPELKEIGRRVLDERAAVLTFNYDTIVESAIERFAGDNEELALSSGHVPDEHLGYSKSRWNRALAYGTTRFDEVHLQQNGVVLNSVEGKRFYNHPDNRLYGAPILKLHGSLNWFVHTSRRSRIHPYGLTENPKAGQVVLSSGFPHIRHGFGLPEDMEGWILKPLIVTPVLLKT